MVSIFVKQFVIFLKIETTFFVEENKDNNVKMLVLKWNKVFDGVQLIQNRLQQDVQLHSEFKGYYYFNNLIIKQIINNNNII